MEKFIKIGLDSRGEDIHLEDVKINLTDFDNGINKDNINEIREFILQNIEALINDEIIQNCLRDFGYTNAKNEKDVNEKLSFSEYNLVSHNFYNLLRRNVNVNSIPENDLENIIKGNYKLVAVVNEKSLERIEPLKAKYKVVKQKIKDQTEKRKAREEKKLNSKKQKEIEKAKKLLQEAGVKI